MKTILILFIAMLSGCAAQVASTSDVDPCAEFTACTAERTAAVTCINGTCACITSLPGENRAVSCSPDGDK